MPVRPRVSAASPVLVAALCAAATGCLPQPPPQIVPTAAAPPRPRECFILPGETAPGGLITFALADPVSSSNAPCPSNGSERIVFGSCYETLVALDCGGAVAPALADWWTSSDGGRVWVLNCREDARFSNGASVRAADVEASWERSREQARARGGSVAWAWLDAHGAAFEARPGTIVVITLAEPSDDLLTVLADPAMAIAQRAENGRWPHGTGAFRFDHTAGAEGTDIVCLPNDDYRGTVPPCDGIVFKVRPDWDQRDLLSDGVDALIARDRTVLSYFASAGGFTATERAPDRLYLLVAPPANAERPLPTFDRSELAREIVASAARPATTIFFRNPAGSPCVVAIARKPARDESALAQDSTRSAAADTVQANAPLQILYDESDADAQRLAERLAALDQHTPAATAAGLASPLFAAAIEEGALALGILPVERVHANACMELSALVSRAPWIARAAHPGAGRAKAGTRLSFLTDEEGERNLLASGAATPLVATHPVLLTRDRLAGVGVAYDGTLLLGRAGWMLPANVP